MNSHNAKALTSDGEYIERARAGDTSAFAELWRRHYRSAVRVARQFTSIDADDLVSEAYVRIYQRVLAGGGPTGAFRPYLYTTIRNLASSWGAASRDVQVDMIEDFQDERIPEDPAVWALDRTLTATAFRTLPERWQTVLWYTEVEGMDPHEVAPIMGMTANGVAALSYRAREGLRKAWLQAHISDEGLSDECRWAMTKLGENARNGLGKREKARLDSHLPGCTRCSIVSDEVDEVGSRLALVLLPMMLGGVAGGSLLAALASNAAPVSDLAVPPMPDAVDAVVQSSLAAAPVAGGLALGATASAGPGVLVGGIAVVAVLGGGLVVSGSASSDPDPAPPTTSSSSDASERDPGEDILSSLDAEEPDERPVDPSDIASAEVGAEGGTPTADTTGNDVGGAVGEVVGGVGEVVGDVVGEVGDVVSEVVTADVTLNLSGTATPGATLSLTAAGSILATTKVAADGTFQLSVSGLPGDTVGLTLSQSVDRGYLESLLGSRGILGTLLRPLDSLVNDLIAPLRLNSSSALPVTVTTG